MPRISATKQFLLWLFAAALALVAAGITFVRNGEVNGIAILTAVVFAVMAIVSRAKRDDAG